MGARLKSIKSTESPGPCYSIPEATLRRGKSATPSYSLSGRLSPPKPVVNPAPGAYRPEGTEAVHTRAPAYTMRPRTATIPGTGSPAPNVYNLPSLTSTSPPTKTTAPAYSLRPRLATGSPYTISANPSPAHYGAAKIEKTSLSRTAPAFTMSARVFAPLGGGTSPGPSAYSVARSKSTNQGSSFGVRHSPYSLSPMV